MGFVRKLTGVQSQIDAVNSNTDAQIVAAKKAAEDQVNALNASAQAAADAQKLAAQRQQVESEVADAASKPLAVADVALDSAATNSAAVTRRKTREQFGKNYGSGSGVNI